MKLSIKLEYRSNFEREVLALLSSVRIHLSTMHLEPRGLGCSGSTSRPRAIETEITLLTSRNVSTATFSRVEGLTLPTSPQTQRTLKWCSGALLPQIVRSAVRLPKRTLPWCRTARSEAGSSNHTARQSLLLNIFTTPRCIWMPRKVALSQDCKKRANECSQFQARATLDLSSTLVTEYAIDSWAKLWKLHDSALTKKVRFLSVNSPN